jgi:FixJ family two-component response regulator
VSKSTYSIHRRDVLIKGDSARAASTLYVVDDDDSTADVLRLLLKTLGLQVQTYASPVAFIEEYAPDGPGCILMDLRMPELNGLETVSRLHEQAKAMMSRMMPVIMISGFLCPSVMRRALRQGVVDFFEKPLDKQLLLESIQHWLRYDVRAHARWQRHQATKARLEALSKREREVLTLMLDGMSNKEIARHLGVSPKTIEVYRASLMRKMQARTAAGLAAQVVGCLEAGSQPAMCPSCLRRPR